MSLQETTRERGWPPLSVVVVVRNGECRLSDCLESVLVACRGAVPAFEVFVVDAASTDRAITRAMEFPVSVLRLPADHASPGAGRHVGDQAACGRLRLHLDGDTILAASWLPEAVAYLLSHDDVAGVGGNIGESGTGDPQDVDSLGGVALYDGEALGSVGGFDPHLLGHQDAEVGRRLSAAGYRLVRLPSVAGFSSDRDGGLAEPVRRWQEGRYLGVGQIIRKAVPSPRLLATFLPRGGEAVLLGWLCLGALTLPEPTVLLMWGVLSSVGAVAATARVGADEATARLAHVMFGLAGLLLGLAEPRREAGAYPLVAVEVVRPRRILEPGDGRDLWEPGCEELPEPTTVSDDPEEFDRWPDGESEWWEQE